MFSVFFIFWVISTFVVLLLYVASQQSVFRFPAKKSDVAVEKFHFIMIKLAACLVITFIMS